MPILNVEEETKKFEEKLKNGYYGKTKKPKSKKKKSKHSIFFKIITGGIILHGVTCVSMSYYLALTEHSQIAESLSATIITEIIAPIVVYGITKTIENIFEKNKLAFSVPLKTLEREEESNG